jgi:hypothetical protein
MRRGGHHFLAAPLASVYAGPVCGNPWSVVLVELVKGLLLKVLAVFVPRHIFSFPGALTPCFRVNMAEGAGIEPQSR